MPGLAEPNLWRYQLITVLYNPRPAAPKAVPRRPRLLVRGNPAQPHGSRIFRLTLPRPGAGGGCALPAALRACTSS